jgi:hypothetical protein
VSLPVALAVDLGETRRRRRERARHGHPDARPFFLPLVSHSTSSRYRFIGSWPWSRRRFPPLRPTGHARGKSQSVGKKNHTCCCKLRCLLSFMIFRIRSIFISRFFKTHLDLYKKIDIALKTVRKSQHINLHRVPHNFFPDSRPRPRNASAPRRGRTPCAVDGRGIKAPPLIVFFFKIRFKGKE